MTKNGSGSACVVPSTVTWCSAIASSSALCVRGGARLISSASSTCAKIGPGWNSKRRACASNTDTPTMSEGSRSDVNCTRWKPRPERRRQRMRKRGLAQARQVLDQQVAVGQQRDERQPHFLRLAEHQRVDLGDRAGRAGPAERRRLACSAATGVADMRTSRGMAVKEFRQRSFHQGRVGRSPMADRERASMRFTSG